MRKTPTKRSIKAKSLQPSVMATIKVLGKTFTATGETTREAISNLKPGNCKGRGIIIVEKDGLKRERILMPALTFRLFNASGFTREVALKNILLLFS